MPNVRLEAFSRGSDSFASWGAWVSKQVRKKYEQSRCKQIMIQHVSAVHGQGNALGRSLGKIAQQAGGISKPAAQIDQPAGWFVEGKVAQQVSQQNITEESSSRGLNKWREMGRT